MSKEAQSETIETTDELTELDNLKEPELSGAGDDYDPAQDEAADKALALENQQLQVQAQASAAISVTVLESAISMMYPGVTVDPAQKQLVAEKLVPVLVKYQAGGMPPWLAKYKEEMELIGVVGMAGFSIYQQVKAQKAKDITGDVQDGDKSEPKAA